MTGVLRVRLADRTRREFEPQRAQPKHPESQWLGECNDP